MNLKIKNFFHSIFSSIYDSLGIFMFLVGFYIGFPLLKENKIDLLYLFVVIMVMIFSLSFALQCLFILEYFNIGIISYNGIFNITDLKPKIDPSNSNGIRDVPLNGKITLDHIKFHYPSSPIIKMEEKVEGKEEDGMKN